MSDVSRCPCCGASLPCPCGLARLGQSLPPEPYCGACGRKILPGDDGHGWVAAASTLDDGFEVDGRAAAPAIPKPPGPAPAADPSITVCPTSGCHRPLPAEVPPDVTAMLCAGCKEVLVPGAGRWDVAAAWQWAALPPGLQDRLCAAGATRHVFPSRLSTCRTCGRWSVALWSGERCPGTYVAALDPFAFWFTALALVALGAMLAAASEDGRLRLLGCSVIQLVGRTLYVIARTRADDARRRARRP